MTIFYCLRFETPPNLEGQVLVFISTRKRHCLPFSSPTVRKATVEAIDCASTRGCNSQINTNFLKVIYTNPGRTSQEAQHVSAIEPNRLMLFRGTVAVCWENHTEHTNTLCGRNAQFFNVKAGGTHSYHFSLKG
jgi:hypothetical protein